jgi:hypothetical protein
MIVLYLLGLLLVVIGAVAATELLIMRADVAAALVLATVVVQALFVDEVPSLGLPGGTRVFVTDVIFGLLLAAALARMLRLRRFDRFQRWLLLLGVVLAVSLLRGMATFGVQTSVNEFRQYLVFFGVVLYFATFSPTTWLLDRVGRIWLFMTIPMMVLVCLRWLRVFAGVDLGVPVEKWGADAAIRVVDGPYVFFLASAFILTIPAWLRGDGQARRLRWLSVLLLLFILVLNRRTVWLAVPVGVAVLMLRDRRLGRRALLLTALGAVMAVVAFVALGGLKEEAQPVVASDSGNFGWRVQGWTELVQGWSRQPADWVVGEPFGSGFARKLYGIEVESHPHNFYIETMLRTGLIGLVALIALTVGLLRALWRGPARNTGPPRLPDLLPALLAMQVVWFLTWVPGNEQGIVIGLAMAVAATRSAGAEPEPDPEPALDRKVHAL